VIQALTTAHPAKVVDHDGRSFWRCPHCNRTLGELLHRIRLQPEIARVGSTPVVQILANRRHVLVEGGRVEQGCPCGVRSYWENGPS
jgi:hypothetical protein